MIRAVALDDEKDSIEVLKMEIKTHCPDVRIIAQFQDAYLASEYLLDHETDVLFLDIEMPHMNGFQFLMDLKSIPFEIIFVTAYQNYAIRAFDFYAVDYLLKPITPDRLVRAIERLRIRLRQKNLGENPDKVLQLLNSLKFLTEEDKRMSIPSMDGFEIVQTSHILYIEADGNYSTLFLKENKKITATKSLKEFEEFLGEHRFLRIHNSVIIRLSQVKKYIRGDGGSVLMTDDKELPVSRANKIKLLASLKGETDAT